MCGLFAAFTESELTEREKSIVSTSLQSRGPDSSRWEVITDEFGVLSLFHARLAITDLDERSNQPMVCDGVYIVFNGEIYNYKELKKSCEDAGHYIFHTESDTEVILAHYIKYGLKSFEMFEGPYALVIYDSRKKWVIAARDRFGEKPLFMNYNHIKRVLKFASHPDLISEETALSSDFINEFCWRGYSISDKTPFIDVVAVEAGSVSVYDLNRTELIAKEKIPYAGVVAIENDGSDQAFYDFFYKSMKQCLQIDSEVKTGLLLSGGIDSSFIAIFAAEELGLKLDCYTIVTDPKNEAEDVVRAGHICKKYGLKHVLIDGSFRKIHSRPYLPVSDPAYDYLVSIYSSLDPSIKVVVTGDGADEIFLSYSNYKSLILSDADWPESVSFISRLASRYLSPGFLRRFGMSNRNIFAAVLHNSGLRIDKSNVLASLRNYALEYDLSRYLVYKADAASMAFSIEARSPFLNPSLFCWADSYRGKAEPLIEKKVLVNYINEKLEADLGFNKRGFAAGKHRSGRSWLNNILNRIFNDRLHRTAVFRDWIGKH